MSRHDQLWKSLLQAFLPEFIELVQPAILDSFKAREAVFLEQEAFRDPLAGSYSKMDVVAQLPAKKKGPPGILLVLIEVEARFRREMDWRILTYYRHLRLKHQQMVLPVVLFLRGGPQGVEKRWVRERILDFEVVRFGYWAFGLSQADAEDFLGRNSLTPALAACMRSKGWRPSEKKLECLLSILESSVDDARKFLLVNAVETYVDLAEDEMMNYSELLAMSTRGQEVEAMEMTWADKIELRGRAKGLEQGRHEGLTKGRSEGVRKVVVLMIEERFGPLDAASRGRLEAIVDQEELESLSRRLLTAESLADLGLSG